MRRIPVGPIESTIRRNKPRCARFPPPIFVVATVCNASSVRAAADACRGSDAPTVDGPPPQPTHADATTTDETPTRDRITTTQTPACPRRFGSRLCASRASIL